MESHQSITTVINQAVQWPDNENVEICIRTSRRISIQLTNLELSRVFYNFTSLFYFLSILKIYQEQHVMHTRRSHCSTYKHSIIDHLSRELLKAHPYMICSSVYTFHKCPQNFVTDITDFQTECQDDSTDFWKYHTSVFAHRSVDSRMKTVGEREHNRANVFH